MRLCKMMMTGLAIFLSLISIANLASPWTNFKEYPPNLPIYDPYPDYTLWDDYYPCIIYNKDKFDGHGEAYLYKMWHCQRF